MNKLRRARVGILPQPLLRKIIMRHARGPQNAARCHSRCCGAKLLIRRALPPEKKWLRRARHSRCCVATFLTRRAPQVLWGKTSHTARAAPRKKVAAARSPQSLLRGNISHTARPARITGCDAPLWGNLPQSQLWGKISHTARAPRARHSRCCAAPFLTRRARPARKTACDAPLWGNLPQSQLWGKISHTARAPQKETGPQKLGAARSARRYWQKLSRGTPGLGKRTARG